MAKDLDVNFDASSFIDSFPEDNPTTIDTPKETPKQKSGQKQTKRSIHGLRQSNKTRAAPISEPTVEYTESESDYFGTFIDESDFINVTKNGTQIFIRNEFRKKIRNILSVFEGRISTAGYIDNVLKAHFEQYGSTIKNLLKKEIDNEEY